MSGHAVKLNDKSYRQKLLAMKIFRMVICVILCIVSLLPFILMFVNATRSSTAIKASLSLIPSTHLLENWANFGVKQSGFQITVFQAMLNSLKIAVPATFLSVYVSALTAYGIEIYDFRLKNAAWTFIMAVMLVPTTISVIGFYRFMVKLNLIDTYIPLIIPAACAPAVIFFMREYMQSSFPKEIVEASRIDGSGEFRTFNRIAVPLMKPALATQCIFQFVASWNNLFLPTMIITTDRKKTLPLFVEMLRSDQFKTDYGILYIALAITILPLFVVYFILSKYIVAGVALGGVKE